MSMLSIDIGTRSLTAVEGAAAPSGVIDISCAAVSQLAPDTVSDGIIKQPTEIMTKLEMMSKANGFKSRSVVVTINGGNMLMREFDVPLGKPRQMEAIVRNEMISTYAAAESDVIEGKVIGSVEKDGAKFASVRAMAVSRDLAMGYYNLLQSAKLKPVAMDAHSNALEKLLAGKPKLNGADLGESCSMLLDFGYAGIMCYILSGYTIAATRYIPLGMSDLAGMLSSQMLISADEENGNFSSVLDFGNPDKRGEPIMLTAENFLTQCCNEIQRVIMYALPRLTQSSVSKAFIYGGGSKIPGIGSFIGGVLGFGVEPLTSVSNVRFKRTGDEKLLPRCLNAAGALIRL